MLSDKDIDKLTKAFASKQDINELKEDVGELKDRMDTFEQTQREILTAVEGFASKKDREVFENAARDTQQTRHDKWIHQIATETNVKLKD